MAYVNFSEAAPAGPAAGATRSQQGLFSPLEWLVIGLARKDRPSSLVEPGRLTRAMRSLFGLGAVSRLADERLERLRRFAVLAWQPNATLPRDEVRGFLKEFSRAQYDALIAITRQSNPRRSAA